MATAQHNEDNNQTRVSPVNVNPASGKAGLTLAGLTRNVQTEDTDGKQLQRSESSEMISFLFDAVSQQDAGDNDAGTIRDHNADSNVDNSGKNCDDNADSNDDNVASNVDDVGNSQQDAGDNDAGTIRDHNADSNVDNAGKNRDDNAGSNDDNVASNVDDVGDVVSNVDDVGDVVSNVDDVGDVASNMDDVGDVASNVDAENAGSNADNTATTEESSQDSLMMIPETTEDHDEVSSDDEVDGDLVVAHDDFAIRFIKKTKVHFRLRRTTPTLWRHEAICFVAMRVFTAIDDSKHIATAGVNWQIDGKICTVLVVACLGYAPDPGRTAKVADTRATEIIVRESKYGTSAIKFSQMRKVSSLARFHKHTHTHTYLTHTHTHHKCRSRRSNYSETVHQCQ